jgi:hypothetical protein
MQTPSFQKTMVVWQRFGKEHGESQGFRVNSPKVITNHLRQKRLRFLQTPEKDWRWWQVDEYLVIERWDNGLPMAGPDTRIYYLLDRGLAVIENIHLQDPGWKWYIHIASFRHDSALDAWIMKDLFCDVLVERDRCSYQLIDLDDLGLAIEMGLVTSAETSDILKRTDWMLRQIYNGNFPLPEVTYAQQACKKLGWD